MLEYVTTLIAQLDRRFDTLHQDLKDSITDRFSNSDLRYQQRFDAQKEALSAAFAAQETATNAALAAQKEAVTKAEAAANERFKLLNELRSGVATKEQVEALALRLSDLKERLDKSEGHGAGLNAGWIYLLGAVAAIGTVVSLLIAFKG
jgi:hypothetical protein